MLVTKLQDYAQLIRLDKPIGTLLLLWPTLSAVVLASHGHPTAKIVFIFMLGVFLTRAAGCILNDIADRNLDKHVERTRNRPITAGRVSVNEALAFCAVLLFIGLILVLFLNITTVVMAAIAVVLAAIYPFLKRFTHLPQVWLGVAFNWGILMAFTATQGHIPVIGYLLYLAALLLTVAYDTMYGMADKHDDLRVGIKSTAILFGEKDKLIVAILQVIAVLLLLLVGLIERLNGWFYLGLLVMGLGFIYQHLLIKNREPAKCFQAFLNNNYTWLAIFMGLLLNFLS